MESRRIGTFTLGVCLLLFGILFLLHIFLPGLNYLLIFRLWPLVFILLGCELLLASRKASGQFKYDFAAVVLLLLLLLFAMGMAGFDYLLTHFPEECWLGLG